MKYLITFSGDRYHEWTRKTAQEGHKHGADKVLVFDDIWMKNCRTSWIKDHDYLFKKRCAITGSVGRGFGWFFWKPLVMLDALNRMSDGDILLYTDGDTYPIADLNCIYDQCVKDGGFMFFRADGHLQRHWAKHDMQYLMNQDSDYFRDKPHIVARFMLFQKGAKYSFGPTSYFPEGGVVTPEEFLNLRENF